MRPIILAPGWTRPPSHRASAHAPTLLVGGHEELTDRPVELAQRPADHQLLVGERADQLVDRGHVTDSGGANVQPRDPQTPDLDPGVLALTHTMPRPSGPVRA